MKYKDSKSNDQLINSEGMYIYKLYKKNKLPFEKVEQYLKKLCVSVINDESNVSISLTNYEKDNLNIMIPMIDNIIKIIVNNKLYISSLKYISSRPVEDSSNPTYHKLYDFIKSYKVYNYESLNVNSFDYEMYWSKMLK